MTRILIYLQPVRTYVPCSGVGRHINGMVLELANRPGVEVELLFSRQWLGSDGKLPANCPLRHLPFRTFALPERVVERSWKLIGWPSIEKYLAGFDFLYCPSDTAFPVTSIPSFVTIHDIHPLDPLYPAYDHVSGWWGQRQRWQKWVARAFQTSSAVLTVSDFCKSRMEVLLPQRQAAVHVIGNGVDEEFFALGERDPGHCEVPGAWPFVLVIGGLTDRKGAEATLRVAQELKKSGSGLRIVVVGKSEAHWIEQVASYDNIVLCGPLSDELMGQYLRGASALLFLSQYEGFGIPIIEAMAAGVPVVCSDTSSLPEVAGEAGYVFPSRDANAIADCLNRLIDRNDCERKSRVDAGLERARSFTWKVCIERLLCVFNSVDRKACELLN